MQKYEEITAELFQEARGETDRQLAQACATAEPDARRVVTYVRQNLYRPLSAPEIRKATGFTGSFKPLLAGARSVNAYLGSARIETAKRMNAAQRVPTGCIMRRVGISSCTTFRRLWAEHAGEPLVLFKAPERLLPDFDTLSWYHLVTGMPHPAAAALAETLFQAHPGLRQEPIRPIDFSGQSHGYPRSRGHFQPSDVLALASQKPLRTVDWACDAIAGCVQPLLPYLKEKLSSTAGGRAFNRWSSRPPGKPLVSLPRAASATICSSSSVKPGSRSATNAS